MNDEYINASRIGYSPYSKISLTEAAKIMGLEKSHLSKIKSRNAESFPAYSDYKLYYMNDIIRFAYEHNYTINGKKVMRRDVEATLYKRYGHNVYDENVKAFINVLEIKIIGMRQKAKTHIASLFMEKASYIRRILCRDGSASCITCIHEIDASDNEGFELRIDNEDLRNRFKEYKKKDVEALKDIEAGKILKYNNFTIDMLNSLYHWIQTEKEEDKLGDVVWRQGISIHVYGKPSRMAKNIMREAGIDRIYITDSYGKDEAVPGTTDLCIFAIGNDDEKEFKAYYYDVFNDKLNSRIPFIYIYNTNAYTKNSEDYSKDYIGTGKMNSVLKSYYLDNNEYDINASIYKNNIQEHCIALPHLYEHQVTDAEKEAAKLLGKHIIDKIGCQYGLLNYTEIEKVDNSISKKIIQELDEIVSLIPGVCGFKKAPNDYKKYNKALKEFIGKHGLTKSKDKNIIENEIIAKRKEFLSIVEYYVINGDDVKRIIAIEVYRIIKLWIEQDFGMGDNEHWMCYSPLTLRACERILAPYLWSGFRNSDPGLDKDSEIYIEEVMRKVFPDNSFAYVKVSPNYIDYIKRLAESTLMQRCESEDDLIEYCGVYAQVYMAVEAMYVDLYRNYVEGDNKMNDYNNIEDYEILIDDHVREVFFGKEGD